MELELRMKYMDKIYPRYRKASKGSKGRILDELCHVCGYSRKYAIWKLSQFPLEERPRSRVKRRRLKRYGHEVLFVVAQLWEAANCPWSVRLKEILRLWLPWIRLRYEMSREKSDELKSLRERLDPFSLAEAINSKLEGIWDLVHYRYQSFGASERSSAKEGELSSVERQVLVAISHILGMNIYVGANKKRELGAIRDG
jgi:hypothetical protein